MKHMFFDFGYERIDSGVLPASRPDRKRDPFATRRIEPRVPTVKSITLKLTGEPAPYKALGSIIVDDK